MNKYEAAKEMWRKDAEAISMIGEQITEEQYEALYQAIAECRGKVAVSGMGTSGVAARKVVHMLRVADFPAFFLSAGDCAHGALGAIREDDVLIFISKGGTTEELVSLLPSVKRKKCRLIVVTSNENSPLALAADLIVKLDIPESDHKALTANAGILAVIALFDAVADELTNRPEYTDETLYYNHIHGNVGEILKAKISN